MDFGDLLIQNDNKRLKKKVFQLKSNCPNMIRFELKFSQEIPWVKIKPSLGHLSPNMKKRIAIAINQPENVDEQIILE